MDSDMAQTLGGGYRFTVYIENRYLRIDICIEWNMSVSKKIHSQVQKLQ